jgi:hypothetical protein
MQRAINTSKLNPQSQSNTISRNRLLAVKRTILASPDSFDMDGESHCIAGVSLRLAGRDPDTINDPLDAARKLLELNVAEADSLFAVGGWPVSFRNLYVPEPTTSTAQLLNATVAAARIEHFLNSGN